MLRKKTKPKWLIKAYNNYDFLNSPSARTIRVLSEMLEPAERFRRNKIKNTVVFFGSARILPHSKATKELKNLKSQLSRSIKPSKNLLEKIEIAKKRVEISRYYHDAEKLATRLTRWFKTLKILKNPFVICSGGGPGIMEAANKGARKAKGLSVGLNISLPMEQHPNKYQTKRLAFEFHYFFIRKFWFFYLAKALVIFPGGYGTLDELFELLTIIQTQKTQKNMPVVLYGSDYWKRLINFEEMIQWGMISKEDIKLFRFCDNVEDAFNYLKRKLTLYYLNPKNAISNIRTINDREIPRID